MTNVHAFKTPHQPSFNERVIVKARSLLDNRVYIGNGDKDLCGPVGYGFGNGKLVQIVRVIVVDRAPGKVPEITRRFLNSRR